MVERRSRRPRLRQGQTVRPGCCHPTSARPADAQRVRYDPAPPWANGVNCTSYTDGAADLRRHIQASFPGVDRIGGFNCRANNANTLGNLSAWCRSCARHHDPAGRRTREQRGRRSDRELAGAQRRSDRRAIHHLEPRALESAAARRARHPTTVEDHTPTISMWS